MAFSLFLGEAVEWSGCSLSALRNFCDVRFHVMVSSEVIAAGETTEQAVHHLAGYHVLPPETQSVLLELLCSYWSFISHR